MNLAGALRALGARADRLPVEALAWARDHWDLAGPVGRQILARVLKDVENTPERDLAQAYYLLHVAATRRDGSFVPLAGRLLRDPEALDLFFGMESFVTLTPLLIALFGEQPSALIEHVRPDAADPEVCGHVFEALAYLAAAGALERSALETALSQFEAEAPREPGLDWLGFARAVALLDIADLMPLVERACAEGRVPAELAEWVDLQRLAQVAREERGGLGAFDAEGVRPYGDVVAEMEKLEADWAEANEDEDWAEEDEDGEAGAAPPGETIKNPFRDIGRNDPCPCGSGKKYKKCCLAEAGLGSAGSP